MTELEHQQQLEILSLKSEIDKLNLELTGLKFILNRWYNYLCQSGHNTKSQVRKEIKDVMNKLEDNYESR